MPHITYFLFNLFNSLSNSLRWFCCTDEEAKTQILNGLTHLELPNQELRALLNSGDCFHNHILADHSFLCCTLQFRMFLSFHLIFSYIRGLGTSCVSIL